MRKNMLTETIRTYATSLKDSSPTQAKWAKTRSRNHLYILLLPTIKYNLGGNFIGQESHLQTADLLVSHKCSIPRLCQNRFLQEKRSNWSKSIPDAIEAYIWEAIHSPENIKFWPP